MNAFFLMLFFKSNIVCRLYMDKSKICSIFVTEKSFYKFHNKRELTIVLKQDILFAKLHHLQILYFFKTNDDYLMRK